MIIYYLCEDGIENPSLKLTICHHSASILMPIGDSLNRLFYPTLTPIIDSYVVTYESMHMHLGIVKYLRTDCMETLYFDY